MSYGVRASVPLFLSFLGSLILLFFFASRALSLTIAVGKPYNGRLINGIPFPAQFRGYRLCSPSSRTYATPELIGGLLDALEDVLQRYPDTCDLCIRDFSKRGGGPLRRHKSHQNGRDVDIGMYAKNNRQLSGFIPMNRANLDVAKTWFLILSLIKTRRVQYIFLDRRIQRILYRYAYSNGWDRKFLEHLFKDVGTPYPDSIIRDVPGHRNHMHVRFYAPWSCFAATVSKGDREKLALIALAQEAYLPKRIKYYIKGNEGNLHSLARSFGVSYDDLCRWNNLTGSERLRAGRCLVFFKRGFEIEPVTLASISQLPIPRRTDLIHIAGLKPNGIVFSRSAKPRLSSRIAYYRVKAGDTLWKIAKNYNMKLDFLCRLNNITPDAILRPAQRLKVLRKSSTVSRKIRFHIVRSGESLWKIARQYGVTVDRLRALNNIARDDILKPGQKLRIAGNETRVGKELYIVKPGDSLWAIAKRYHTSVREICRLNDMSESVILRPGAKIKIP